MILRYWYLLMSSWPRMLELLYWPALQIITWGFLQNYISQTSGFFARAGGIRLRPHRRSTLATAAPDRQTHLPFRRSRVTSQTETRHERRQHPERARERKTQRRVNALAFDRRDAAQARERVA